MAHEISIKCKIKVRDMMADCLSYSEMAKLLGISRRSVMRIAAQWNIIRTPEEISRIMSRSRKELLRKEKSRVIFGLEQKTRLKVFPNKERHKLKFLLKRKGYIVNQGSNRIYYPNERVRKYEYEIKGKSLGLKFYPLDTLLKEQP
ncbi:MAG: DNA-binding protein [Muribaculaceae bacterium]|nr:DNA-binding protein [Muribaculaceae bacterium]